MGAGVEDFVRVREAGFAAEGLAVLTTDTIGVSNLVVLHDGGLVAGPFNLGMANGVALHAADIDGVHGDDLLVTSNGDNWLRVLRHQGGGVAPYDVGTMDHVRVAGDSADFSGQRVNAVAGDFDSDGDLDLLQLVEPLREAAFRRSENVPEYIYRPTLTSVQLDLNASQPVPRVTGTVSVPAMPQGATPTAMDVELWGTLPGGPSVLGDHAASFLLGSQRVDLLAGQTELSFDVIANINPGDLVYLNVRFISESSGATQVGIDGMWEFDLSLDGSGGGSGDDKNGQGGFPPPDSGGG